MPFFYVDWYYIVLVLPAVILSLWASAHVKSTFRRYSQVRNARGMPGAAAAMGGAATTAVLRLLGGMILVVLGIMGEYVGRIYMCANAAPQYVEREVIRHEENDA